MAGHKTTTPLRHHFHMLLTNTCDCETDPCMHNELSIFKIQNFSKLKAQTIELQTKREMSYNAFRICHNLHKEQKILDLLFETVSKADCCTEYQTKPK